MSNFKSREVIFARFHAGVSIGPKVLNSAYIGKDGVTKVEITDVGILVTSQTPDKVFEDLIPFGNILTVRLHPSVESEVPSKASKK